MLICKLTIENYNDIIKLWKSTDLPYKPLGRDSKFAIEFQMKKNPDFFLGAYDEGRLVGIVIASYDNRRGWINRLAVDPEYRRKGVAKRLVAVAEKALRKKGAKIIGAHVDSHNVASLDLFKKCGYVEHRDVVYLSKRKNDEI